MFSSCPLCSALSLQIPRMYCGLNRCRVKTRRMHLRTGPPSDVLEGIAVFVTHASRHQDCGCHQRGHDLWTHLCVETPAET